jgi:uncharacterized protein YaaN involved in tellurite resistance
MTIIDIDEFANMEDVLQSIESLGADLIKSSAAKNSLLQMKIRSLAKDGDEGSVLAKCLMDLQRELKDLDPSPIDFTKTGGILCKLFDPVRAYFAKYQKADEAIADIIASLDKGIATLKNDNTILEIEQQALHELTRKLNKEIRIGTLMDELIEKQIEAAKARNVDPEKVKFATEEVLFPLRQRLMDLQQMIVVNQQGAMATELVIGYNKELMRRVERATNMWISFLRALVMVASAPYNKKRDEWQMLIGPETRKEITDPNISFETLKASFADVMEALDSIITYIQEALPKMWGPIDQFKELAAKKRRTDSEAGEGP